VSAGSYNSIAGRVAVFVNLVVLLVLRIAQEVLNEFAVQATFLTGAESFAIRTVGERVNQ
jgi:hypothetical protein